MQTSIISRSCPCFAGAACRCASGQPPFVWKGRLIPGEMLAEAHRDFRTCVRWGLIDWSANGWRSFFDGYVDMAAFYGRRSMVRVREYVA